MDRIERYDPNFKVNTNLNQENITFYNALSEQFSLHGVFYEKDQFVRLPTSIAQTVSPTVAFLGNNTAGGRVRFYTDSTSVAISAKMPQCCHAPHFPTSGSVGFDMYADGRFVNCFMPPQGVSDGYDSLLHFPDKKIHLVTINLPLYSSVSGLHIGVAKGALLIPGPKYPNEHPVVFYGSSITQGGCASRPGNTYEAILSRMLNFDYVNLGFSGGAKGELEIANYIAGLSMSAFVMDYDYNSPSLEHLQETHERMFRIIRAAHPNLPILLVSKPLACLSAENRQRRDMIRSTYENARVRGDHNVYFLDGSTMYDGQGGDSCTVDGRHPNDLGFMAMAKAMEPILRSMLGSPIFTEN